MTDETRTYRALMRIESTLARIEAKLDTLEAAFKVMRDAFTKSEITLALDAMLREEKAVTGSRYDWLAGFTAVAREMRNADDRSALEVQASKVLLQTQ